MKFISRGIIKIDFDLNQEVSLINQLLQRYQSLPMSFADGCLVRMTELLVHSFVFTLDSDFRIYRKQRNQSIN